MLLLKVLIVLVAGLSGAFGIFSETRDKQSGRITRAGWITFGIVLLSALMGMILEFGQQRAETQKEESQARRAAEAAERTELIVNGVKRMLDGFTTITADYSMSVSTNEPFMKRYVARIANVMDENRNEWYLKDTLAFSPEKREALFFGESPLVPGPDDGDVGRALASSALRIDIFKKHLDSSSYGPDAIYEGDISLVMSDYANNSSFSSTPRWGIKNGRMTVSGCGGDERLYKSNGRIKAVSDLAGAQVFLTLITIPAKNETGELYFPEFRLESIELSTNDGRQIEIPCDQATRLASHDGSVVHMYVFPNDSSANDGGLK